ncbi:MAG: asparagine synthase (glutamine-hydrolyzing) [Chitinophagaceae bacterium]
MCDIYGSTKMYDAALVQKKLDTANFRGPDATIKKQYGDWLWLGHNRLSIIDLDPRSNQPMEYMGIHIVFNGEMYNYQEVKNELQALGFQFGTTSDTEVLCAAYKCWGPACVRKFNGMFAFVIYDPATQHLFGARDRLGKKPFYYSLHNNGFEFASQPRQIAIGNSFTMDSHSVSKFLVWQQIPDPDSIYVEIKRLKAGHSFTYSIASGKFTEESYWDLQADTYNTFNGDYNSAQQELNDLVMDAVQKRMVADVPLGVFLSGGIDSSLIAAIAQRQSAKPVKTFAIKFNEKGFDESPYAEAVAKHLGTEHITITCDFAEGISLIENYNTYYDEPFADASAIPSMLLAKHTRKHVTVALSGDGGDESFIGYSRYDWIKKAQNIYGIPYPIRKLIGKTVALLPQKRYKNLAGLLVRPRIEDAYLGMMSSFNADWLQDSTLSHSGNYAKWLEGSQPLLARVSNYDIKTYMNNDINTKVDRATMAFSLEARAPLMDYRVVEFSRTLPIEYLYHQGVKKRILKDVLYRYVPKEMLDRPKQGFGMPLANWFRGNLKPLVLDLLSDANLQAIPNLNTGRVRQMINSHILGHEDRHVLIWNLLVLVQWMKDRA